MTDIVICPGTSARSLHASWESQALRDVKNADLRQAILNNERFASRIVEKLLGEATNDNYTDDPFLPDPGSAKHLLEAISPAFLGRLGQLWVSPALTGLLLGADQRAKYGIIDRADLKLLMGYQNHCSASIIGQVNPRSDYGDEGAACVLAWCAAQSAAMAARVRVILPPETSFTPQSESSRVQFINLVLADPVAMTVAS